MHNKFTSHKQRNGKMISFPSVTIDAADAADAADANQSKAVMYQTNLCAVHFA